MANPRTQPPSVRMRAIVPSRRELGDGAFLLWAPELLADHEALMARLLEELALESESIVLFGREVPVPRLVAFYGDAGRTYRYSGRAHEPLPWTPWLAEIRRLVVAYTGTGYDTVLVNYYRDGQDAMGRHADDEPELGPAPDDIRVASLSLGARRTFRLKRRRDGARIDHLLGGGDLLVMGGTTQTHWVHEVPRTKATIGPRMNLTFRCVRG